MYLTSMHHNTLSDGQANYGKDEESCIAAVKKVYNELRLEEKFRTYEQESHDSTAACHPKTAGAAAGRLCLVAQQNIQADKVMHDAGDVCDYLAHTGICMKLIQFVPIVGILSEGTEVSK